MDNELDERSSVESILEYAQLLWHWAWLLVFAALISGLAAYYITNRQPRIYQTSTLVMVNAASGSSLDSYSSSYIGQQLTVTYSNTILTKPVMDAVSEELGFSVSAGGISVQPITGTALIKITITDSDPEKAALIANTLVRVYAEQVLSDQTSRYAELKTNLESELSNINSQIEDTQEKLVTIVTDINTLEANIQTLNTQALNGTTESETALLLAKSQYEASLLTKSQYETSLSQFQQTRSYIVQIYQQLKLSEVQSLTTLIQKDPAIVNNNPIQPQPMRSAILAAIVGFVMAAGIIFLKALLEDTIHDPEEITRKWGVPVLGLITNYNSVQNSIITISQPRAPVSESFRSLRTNLQFAGIDKPLRNILVTSASPEDGKTSVVANLANVIAQNDRNVIVIDGDLRRPRIHKIFKLSNRIGLSDYFIRTQDRMDGVIKKTDINRLCVITSGSLPPNPSELLSSDKMMEVINILGKHFNTIILDTPPLLAVTDALVIAPRMDGVILVVDPHKTKEGALKHAIEQLQRVNANLLGVVLNNVKIKRTQYYYNRKYYYGKGYGKDAGYQSEILELSPETVTEKSESD